MLVLLIDVIMKWNLCKIYLFIIIIIYMLTKYKNILTILCHILG